MVAAVKRYLSDTNPIADHPSYRGLKLIVVEEQEMGDWGRAALDAVLTDSKAEQESRAWAAHLTAYVAAAGGIDGTSDKQTENLPRPRPPSRSGRSFNRIAM